MSLVISFANAGTFLKQKELPNLLSYAAEVSYGAIRVSVRLLEKQGMLERVKTGVDVNLIPKELGYKWFKEMS